MHLFFRKNAKNTWRKVRYVVCKSNADGATKAPLSRVLSFSKECSLNSLFYYLCTFNLSDRRRWGRLVEDSPLYRVSFYSETFSMKLNENLHHLSVRRARQSWFFLSTKDLQIAKGSRLKDQAGRFSTTVQIIVPRREHDSNRF